VPTQYAIQPSFGRGELSPRLHARVDIDHWRIGLAECSNFIVMRQGGVRRRPGTQYVNLTASQGANDIVRMVPFQFSVSQSYVLELGHLYMRVHGLGGTVTSGGVPYQITTPWAASDVMRLHFTQSADTIYVTHRNYPPQKLVRRGETNWTIAPVLLEDGPYLDIDITSGTTFGVNSTGNTNTLFGPSSDASATTETAGSEAWHAFDTSPVTEWMAAGPGPAALHYTFSTPRVISGYALRSSAAVVQFGETVGSTTTIYKIPGSLRAPRNWTFEGSGDGVNWTVLHTKAGETGWGDGERRYYTFSNKEAFQYYRLNVMGSNQPDRPVSVAELALQGAGPDIQYVVLEASGGFGINGDVGFSANDIGRHIRILSEDAYWHWFKIAEVNSATSINAELHSPPLPSTKRITQWRLGAFSPATGYPQTSAFYLGRLCYASTGRQPQTIWGSRTDAFDDFSTSIPLKPDDAFSFTFGTVGEIQWLAESGDLLAGTGAAVRSLGPANKTEGFSATNVAQGKPAQVGVSSLQPIQAGTWPVFTGRFLNAIHEASYSYDSQGYTAPDISVMSEHLLKKGVTAIAMAKNPSSIIWCAIADGTLVGVTYEKDQAMTALHRHALGGDGFVESLCTIPGLGRDELWLCVRRTRPDGSTMRTIERLAADFEPEVQAREDAYYVDCGLTYSGAATASLGGFGHLNGFTVQAMADGATEPDGTVTGGVFTLPSGIPASTVHVGFGYTGRGRLLRISQGLGDGSGLGRKKRVKKIMLDVLDTGQLRAKATSRSFQDLVDRSAAETMGAAPALRTGPLSAHIDDQWGGQGVAEWETSGPQPATVRAATLMFDGEP
jgi:hypothetical protein